MQHQTKAETYDCGDGVPDLFQEAGRPTIADDPAIAGRNVTVDELTIEGNRIGAGLALMILTIAGQLAILLAVLAGGDALVGAVAGLALLTCALIVLGAKTLRRVLFDS